MNPKVLLECQAAPYKLRLEIPYCPLPITADLVTQVIHTLELSFRPQSMKHPHANRSATKLPVKIDNVRLDFGLRIAAKGWPLSDVCHTSVPHSIYQSKCNIHTISR